MPALSSFSQFQPLSVLKALYKRKWFIVAFWTLGTASTVAIVYRLQPTYTANAVILVESQKIPETFVTATVQTTLEARLDMLKQQVLSHDRLWSLIETLNLYPGERRERTKEEVLTLMRDDIRITLARGWSARGPGAFQVEYRAPKAETSAEVANRVGMFFITENLRQRTGEAAGTSEFLDRQLADAEARLRENEAVLKQFKLQHNGELPQQEGTLLAAMSQNRTELLGIQEALGRAQQNKLILESSASYAQTLLDEQQKTSRRQAAAASALAATQSETGSGSQTRPSSELQRAQEELRSMRSRYFDSHPDVQRALQEVQRLEREEAAKAANMPKPATASTAAPAPALAETPSSGAYRIEELKAQIGLMAREIDVLEGRRKRVLDEISEIQTRLRVMPVREQQLAGITRDYETCKANYDSLLNKKLAADVAFNMERWQKSQKFVMLDPARVPQKPSQPRRVVLIGGGTLLSLLFGAFLAFLLELRANVLLGEWELPQTSTVLGRIPMLTTDAG